MEMPNQNQSSKNPKKKIIIALSAIVAVIIVVIVAAALIEPPLFQGALRQDVTSVVKDTEMRDTVETIKESELKVDDTKMESNISPELKEEDPKLIPVEKSEEEKPLELNVELKPLEVVTPPNVSFSYRNRLEPLDPFVPEIYGNVEASNSQIVMLFRFTNTGSSPAYLKSFDTFHNFTSIGCAGIGGDCNHLATTGGSVYKVNYDSNGYFTTREYIGRDSPIALQANFSENELTNSPLLEIAGNSNTYFAIYNDTLDYINFGDYDNIRAQAFIDLATLLVEDESGTPLNLTISTDSRTPGTMIYQDNN